MIARMTTNFSFERLRDRRFTVTVGVFAEIVSASWVALLATLLATLEAMVVAASRPVAPADRPTSNACPPRSAATCLASWASAVTFLVSVVIGGIPSGVLVRDEAVLGDTPGAQPINPTPPAA